MSNEEYHVLGLTPKQQLCLRFLLLDLYCNFMEKQLQDLLGENTKELIKSKTYLLLSTFDKYNQLIDLLANKSTVAKVNPKLLTLAPIMMKNVSVAVESYESQGSNLKPADKQVVSAELPNLKQKVSQSKTYTYTLEEIEKIKRSV